MKNAEQILARENEKLQEAEFELSHQLAYAIRDLETNYVLSRDATSTAASPPSGRSRPWRLAYEQGTITLDVLLSAQQTLAQAESDYYRKLVDYNKSISQVHFRKGSLLEYNGVYLAEGPWPGKAYFDARRRARARAASKEFDYGFTQPKVLSRGPMVQNVGTATRAPQAGAVAAPQPELVPSPEPSRPGPARRTPGAAGCNPSSRRPARNRCRSSAKENRPTPRRRPLPIAAAPGDQPPVGQPGQPVVPQGLGARRRRADRSTYGLPGNRLRLRALPPGVGLARRDSAKAVGLVPRRTDSLRRSAANGTSACSTTTVHLVGCVVVVPPGAGRRGGSDAGLRQMAVAERFQRQGHGRRLIAEVESLLAARGFTRLVLHARKHVAPFYEKLGYRVVGEEFIEVTIPHVKMEKTLSSGTR